MSTAALRAYAAATAKPRHEQHTWHIMVWAAGDGGWSLYWPICTWGKSRRTASRKARAMLDSTQGYKGCRMRLEYVGCEDIRHLDLVA